MILSIDFGGTRTRAGWFDTELRCLKREEMLSQTKDPQAVVIQRMVDLARSVVPPGETPAVIGISSPGPQAYTGVIMNAATVPHWDRVPLAQIMSDAFNGAPAHMENDANAAALAEYALGAAQGCDPAIYMTVSTGIGGGAVVGGKLFTGWRGLAVEPGHVKYPAPDGRLLSLEAFASGTGIGRLAREKLAASDAPSVLRSVASVDGKSVGQAAQQGDALALEVINDAGRWLGLGLINIVHMFNPQCVVLGGSVMNLGDLILTPALKTMRSLLIDPLYDDPNLIRMAALGEDVCLIGAAYHARSKLKG